MRLAVRLLRPAANQSSKPGLWQDPVYGYYEQHGKMEFKPGEEYGLTHAEKRAVLHRHRAKEVLKSEYLRREYDPTTFRYKPGVIVDPAMFRWYAADRTDFEFMRHTPRTVFGFYILFLGGSFLLYRIIFADRGVSHIECLEGERLWWDRQDWRQLYAAGTPRRQPKLTPDYT